MRPLGSVPDPSDSSGHSDDSGSPWASRSGGTSGPSGPRILLVSPDLLSTSRIAGLARQEGGSLETLRSLDDPLPGGPYALVLLDLQSVLGDPAVVFAKLRAKLEPQRSADEIGRAHV